MYQNKAKIIKNCKNIFLLSALFVLIMLGGCGNRLSEAENIQISTDDFPKNSFETAENIDESVLPSAETARLSFLAVGDNVIHPCIYMDAQRRAAAEKINGDKNVSEYDFKPMYANVADYITSFDLAFINQETLMAGADFGYSGYPTFNSPRDLAYDLLDLGFDIVNLANNHMCDKGKSGLSATVDFWKELDVTMIGGYSDREDYYTPRIIERDGIKIALIGYTEMTNGMQSYGDAPIVPYTVDEVIIDQLSAAREAADIVIVSVHWGNENWNITTNEQQRLAKLFCDNGADVIIGHHPHVLQPIEWITSTDGEHETLCAYSLGNFVSAMMSWQNMVGGFLTFDIVKMSDGSCFIDSPRFVPTVFYYGPSYFNTYIYFLDEYTESKALSHGTKNLYDSYAAPETMVQYAEKIMGEFISYDLERREAAKERIHD